MKFAAKFAQNYILFYIYGLICYVRKDAKKTGTPPGLLYLSYAIYNVHPLMHRHERVELQILIMEAHMREFKRRAVIQEEDSFHNPYGFILLQMEQLLVIRQRRLGKNRQKDLVTARLRDSSR